MLVQVSSGKTILAGLPTRIFFAMCTFLWRYFVLVCVDEIGVPFAVTVDFDTLKNNTVTLRERDSTLQVRLHKKDVTGLIYAFVHDKMTWGKATEKYPFVKVDEEDGATNIASTLEKVTTVVEKTSRGAFSRPAVPIL